MLLARRLAATVLAVLIVSGLGSLVAGQTPAPRPAAAQTGGAQAPAAAPDERDADETRELLRATLDRYPPALARVLKMDPSLASFVAAHPEIARNPGYYLGDHLRACRLCAEMAAVVSALADERDLAEEAVCVPPAPIVWWRAQLRAREDAARAARRPLGLAAAVAVAFAAGIGIALAIAVSPAALELGDNLVSQSVALLPRVDTAALGATVLGALAHRGVLLALVTWVVLAPVALCLAFARD